MKYRLAAAAWGFLVVLALVFIGVRVSKGNAVDTSLLSLLPAAEGDPLLTEANTLLSQRASHLLAFVVGHSDPSTTVSMGEQLKQSLVESGFIKSILTELSPEQQKASYDFYFPLRYQMLSTDDRQRLRGDKPIEYFLTRLTNSLYSPASSFFKTLIPQDPFLFFPELVRSWIATALPHTAAKSEDGISFVDSDGTSYVFVAAELLFDPFDSKGQDQMLAYLSSLRQKFATQWPGSHLYLSGVLPFASAERLRTEKEMSMVSAGSLIGVLLLAAIVFASLRILLLAALPLVVGFIVAVAVTLLCFGNIHIITFAFGSSLIGVAIDYPLLYLAYHRTAIGDWNSRKALRDVLPGVLFGAATTLMGYAALSLAPFPGLRQMAVFSSVGLCSALISVVFWLPMLTTRATSLTNEPTLLSAGKLFFATVRSAWKNRTRLRTLCVSIVLLAFTLGGLAKLRFDDDVRRLQHPPQNVLNEDAFVRKATSGFDGNRYILVRGNTQEELLERQEVLQTKLESLRTAGVLSSVQSLAPFIPSLHQQQEDQYLLRISVLGHAGFVREGLMRIGLSSDVAAQFLSDLRRPLRVFSIDEWLASPASQLLRPLWIGATHGGFASAVLLGGLTDANRLKESIKDVAGVRFFDQTEEFSNLFRRYRHLSIGLMIFAYLGVWCVMIFRYGVVQGTYVTAPSVVGVFLTFALFGWSGVHVGLIHCLSALLVLSMGIDYAIYFAECARARRSLDSTLLAVELCACSALLSFGLLALCRTPVLSAVGTTVFFGMAIAFLFSPLAYWDDAP